MKIGICGSMNHSNKLIEIADELEKMGHKIELPYTTKKIKNGEVVLSDYIKAKEKSGDSHFRETAEEDFIKSYYKIISEADCILIVNTDKKGIKNYIGGNSFLEMGFAYVLDKPIYLLNLIPDIGYKDEILAMKPIIINGDLEKIRN